MSVGQIYVLMSMGHMPVQMFVSKYLSANVLTKCLLAKCLLANCLWAKCLGICLD
jgi:hypothetical protein